MSQQIGTDSPFSTTPTLQTSPGLTEQPPKGLEEATSSPSFQPCLVAPPELRTAPMQERNGAALEMAIEYLSKKPDWVMFYREVLGMHGLISQLYPTPTTLSNFEKTDEYKEIQHMLTRLRSETIAGSPDHREPTRVITVRMPKSVHESLKSEAHFQQTSMNQLCISKLLQIIDNEYVPE